MVKTSFRTAQDGLFLSKLFGFDGNVKKICHFHNSWIVELLEKVRATYQSMTPGPTHQKDL